MMTKATDKMNTVRKPLPQEARLHRCMMITDGNVSRANRDRTLPERSDNLVSEALLPQIRAVAVMIAAMRHDFGPHSPVAFTDDADWFAARIIVLRARRFHLDITLLPMLKTANRRAQAFARAHKLPFAPAEMHMSLHANRPADLLIVETEYEAEEQGSMIANSLALAAKLPALPL